MITSLRNDKVKYVRRLQADKRFRRREQAFVIEGTRWLAELLDYPRPPRWVFATTDWLDDEANTAVLAQFGVSAQPISNDVMAAMSDTETPQGVLAVVAVGKRPLTTPLSLLLILDRLRDPGNLGAILRTAGAAGIDGVALGPECVDPYNPKVVRASMGALLRLPVQEMEWLEIGELVADLRVWLAAAEGERSYTAVDWTQPSALIIGSEAHGAGNRAVSLAQGAVSIPMKAHTESLNAAMAAGIIIFEAIRQRGR